MGSLRNTIAAPRPPSGRAERHAGPLRPQSTRLEAEPPIQGRISGISSERLRSGFFVGVAGLLRQDRHLTVKLRIFVEGMPLLRAGRVSRPLVEEFRGGPQGRWSIVGSRIVGAHWGPPNRLGRP